MTMALDLDLVGTEEAARILGCSAITVRKIANRGDLANYGDGDRMLLARSEVVAYLERRINSRRYHGPECLLSTCDLWERGQHECQCVSCHCPSFSPGGFLGTCADCGRPLVVDGRVVR